MECVIDPNASARLQRAQLLMQHRRWAEANAVLSEQVAEHPEDAMSLALLALCKLELEALDDATEVVQRAIVEAPDHPFPLYVAARVWFDRGHLDRAQEAIEQAIDLDPEDADQYSLLGAIHVHKKEWGPALSATDSGLELDPEHEGCTHLRALVLSRTGRRDDAARTVLGALERSPDSADAHASRGWVLLHENRPKEALTHFKEALRLDAEHEYAQEGIKEALKAHHAIYRALLRYKLAMDRFRTRYQFMIILGAWLVYRFVLSLARQDGPLAPVFWGVVVLYLLFVVLTWFGDPIFNGLLALNRFGRLALRTREKWSAGLIVTLLAVAATCAVLAWQTTWWWAVPMALTCAVICAPIRMTCEMATPKALKWMAGFTLVCVVLGAVSITLYSSLIAEQERLEDVARRADDLLVSVDEAAITRLDELQGGGAIGVSPEQSYERARSLAPASDPLPSWSEFDSRRRAVIGRMDSAGTLQIIFVLLCVFGSQFAAAAFQVWGGRR